MKKGPVGRGGKKGKSNFVLKENLKIQKNDLCTRLSLVRPSMVEGQTQHSIRMLGTKPISDGIVRYKQSTRWLGTISSGPKRESWEEDTTKPTQERNPRGFRGWAEKRYQGSGPNFCKVEATPPTEGTDTFGTRAETPRGHKVNLVDNAGHISNSLIGIWKCTSAQLFATYVSTVEKRLANRIKRWVRSTNKSSRRAGRARKLGKRFTFDLACLYTQTWDDSLLNRLMETAKRNPEAAKRGVYRRLRNMDEPNRFLYAQLRNSSLWVQHRGFTPCAKSISARILPEFRGPCTTRVPKPAEEVGLCLKRWVEPFTVPPNSLSKEIFRVSKAHKENFVMRRPPANWGKTPARRTELQTNREMFLRR